MHKLTRFIQMSNKKENKYGYIILPKFFYSIHVSNP